MKTITNDQIENMAAQGYQMYQEKPSYLFDDEGVAIFSYNRLAMTVISGILKDCQQRGLTKEQSEQLLRSKAIRHFLDAYSSELENATRAMFKVFPIENYLEN